MRNKKYAQEYNKKYHIKNKTTILVRQKDWREKNKDHRSEYFKIYKERNQERIKKRRGLYGRSPEGKFKEYEENARRRGRNFEISFEVFMLFWQKPCAYCGDSITTVGIDCKDSNKGYVDGNIISCCAICNFMKHTMNSDIFIERCSKVANYNER